MDDAKARAVKEEVRDGWTREAKGWVKHADVIAAWLRETTDVVVAASGARPGARVLDVACGPGHIAFALAKVVGPSGRVTASDLVPAMVEGAQRLARARGVANVDFREADADALPFADASFDVVTCSHGVMFFPQPEKALREMRRVLRPGGRATLLAWGPPEGNPFLTSVSGPFFQRMAPRAPDPDEPGPFRFAAPGSLANVMEAAGFDSVEERAVEVAWDFPGTPEAFWGAVQEISSSLFDWFRAELEPKAFEQAAAEVQAEARRRFADGKVRFQATMVLATGARRA
ncbi:MAG TPA: class I SAM-dependent methyltransferase [Candidatus Thermoplasmatota archaeon]|jgi:SAM-dependent methyltransferase|nr:class I SAM-dependent methyltransferase [Candidatus Thermoplasmatota archaeon]